jgi:hypothetical protein
VIPGEQCLTFRRRPPPDLGELSFQRCGKGVASLFELRPAWVNLADTVAGIFRPFGVFRIAGCETGVVV